MTKPNEDDSLKFGVRNLIASTLSSQTASKELISLLVQQSYTIAEMSKKLARLEVENIGFKDRYELDIQTVNLSILSLMSTVNTIQAQTPETLVSMGLNKYINQ